MSKHKYEVSGITALEGYRFSGKCVASDIIKAIQLFYENGYFVWKIEKKEQVNCDEEIGIKSINMLGVYSATGKSHLNDNLYMKLYSELVSELGEGKGRPERIRKVLKKVLYGD